MFELGFNTIRLQKFPTGISTSSNRGVYCCKSIWWCAELSVYVPEILSDLTVGHGGNGVFVREDEGNCSVGNLKKKC